MSKYHLQLCKKSPIFLVNHIGVKKQLAKIVISEWRRLLALGNSYLGSNSECQSTIYNSAKNILFYQVNQIGVKKQLAEIVISEWKWIWRLGILTWGQNSGCQSTIYRSTKCLPFLDNLAWGQNSECQITISKSTKCLPFSWDLYSECQSTTYKNATNLHLLLINQIGVKFQE